MHARCLQEFRVSLHTHAYGEQQSRAISQQRLKPQKVKRFNSVDQRVHQRLLYCLLTGHAIRKEDSREGVTQTSAAMREQRALNWHSD
eukprot:1955205-Pleurochrysis_carterae.AAC.1